MKLLFSVLALIGLFGSATAQNSKNTLNPDKPMRAATRPITPKSAMPAQSKAPAAQQANSDNGNRKVSGELSRLERGDNLRPRTGSSGADSKAARVPQVKSPSSQHPPPPINATYKKPSTKTAVKKSGW